MTDSIVTIARDGSVITTTDNDAAPAPPPGHLGPHGAFTVGIHSDKPLDGASFFAGLMLGLLLFFIVQTAMRWHARRDVRAKGRAAAIGPQSDDGMAAAVAALARRTATLETIVTDPAHRTSREIEALR